MKIKKGFTLVEMVITIALITILSVISVPLYKDHSKNAKLAEGYALLSAIRDAQVVYYSQYGNFLVYGHSSSKTSQFTCNEEVLGIDARANKYYTTFCVNYCGYTSGGSSPYLTTNAKFYFGAIVSGLMLQYNISLGQKVVDYPADYDNSWK